MNQINASIGRWQGVSLLVTTLLGTGVFLLPQLTIDIAGAGALISWGLLMVAIIPIALVYARLGQTFPHAGGPAQFVELAFSARQGRIIGLMFLLVIPIGAPAAIEMTMAFVQLIIPVEGGQYLLVELLFVSAIFALNWRGIRASSILQSGIALTILAVVVMLALTHVTSSQVREVNTLVVPSFGGVASAFGLAMWSFIGIETMMHLVHEFKNPKRDFRFSLLVGVLLVGVIYLCCTWLLLSVPKTQSLSMASLFNETFGAGGPWVIGLVGTFSGFAAINVYVASAARLMASLSEQQAIPSVFAKLNQYRVPSVALATQASLIAVVLIFSYVTQLHYGELIEWTNGVFVIIYFMSMLAATRILPTFRVLAMLGVVVCLAFAWSLGLNMIYGLLIWACLQLLVSLVGKRYQSQAISS